MVKHYAEPLAKITFVAMSAFLDFAPVSAEEWREKVTTDLKGRPFEDLITSTEEGVDVRPIYSKEDRIATPIPSRSYPWIMHQDFKGSDARQKNKLILEALTAGVSSIGLDSPADLKEAYEVLKDVQVGIIDLYFSSFLPSDTFGQLTELFYDYGTSFAEMSGGILFDPLGKLIRDGSWYESQQHDLDALRAHFGRCSPHADMSACEVNGVQLADAGADHVTELAIVLSQVNEYIEQCKGSISPAEVVRKMCVKLSVDTDFLVSSSKIGAFRLLWQTLLEGHEVADEPCVLFTSNSNWDIAPIDRHTNLLRLTTAAMGAIMGGCDRLSLAPFDGEESSFSMRMSRNIQLLLINESHLDKSIDPLKGAYLLESMSKELAEKAWVKFKEIESSGGFISSVLDGSIQADIRLRASSRLEGRNSGAKPWLGVNLYPAESDSDSLTFSLNEPLNGVTTGLSFPQKNAAV